MADNPLPERIRRRYQVETVDEMWRKSLTEGNAAVLLAIRLVGGPFEADLLARTKPVAA